MESEDVRRSDVDGERLTHLVNLAFDKQDLAARKRAFDRIYDELRKIARAELRHGRFEAVWQATAVVNESFLHWCRRPIAFADSKHFFCYAAKTMRRFLVSCERERRALRRTPRGERVELDTIAANPGLPSVDLLALDTALTELGRTEPELEELVSLRMYSRMTIDEIAMAWGMPKRTIERRWRKACVLLAAEFADEG